MGRTLGATKKNPNWLYRNERNSSFAAIRSKALRLGYPFTLDQKDYAAIQPIQCWHGQASAEDGIRLLLDTRKPALGFSVGNTIFVCERHLGARNLNLGCANTRDIIDHKSIKNSKRNKTKQI
jgi:hypothetical protein